MVNVAIRPHTTVRQKMLELNMASILAGFGLQSSFCERSANPDTNHPSYRDHPRGLTEYAPFGPADGAGKSWNLTLILVNYRNPAIMILQK